MRKYLKRSCRPTLEVLEGRLTPTATVAFSPTALEITDTTANPDYTYGLFGGADLNNYMPQDDMMRATVSAVPQFTGLDLTAVTGPGATQIFNFWWLENDDTTGNDTVAVRSASRLFTPANYNQTMILAPDWGATLRTFLEGEPGVAAEFFIRMYVPGAWAWDSVSSDEIWLRDGALAGGAVRNARTTTPGITFGGNVAMRLDMPGGPGAAYTVYSVSSPDEQNFQIYGGNNTGHSLLNASSDLLANNNGASLEYEVGTTFDTVFNSGSTEIGLWYGDEIIPALSSQAPAHAYMHTALPPILPGNGETVTFSNSEVSSGEEALWVLLPGQSGTVGFVFIRNELPYAGEDAYSVIHDQTLTTYTDQPEYGVLFNDWDMDGQTLSVTKVNGTTIGGAILLPSGATVTMNANGSFTYTPAASYVGQDSFTYTITDSIGFQNGTVTIAVTNEPPSATTDEYSTSYEQGLDILAAQGLLANDYDMDGDALHVTQVNGSTTNVGTVITLASGSTLTVNADGSFTYTPAVGFSGIDSFTYEITDNLETSLATVYIEVFPY